MPLTPLEKLTGFFDWKPPSICPRPSETTISQQQAYRFYNQHLADSLVCKKVVHVPNLHRVVAEDVQATIIEVFHNNYPAAETYNVPTRKKREEWDVTQTNNMMRDLDSVVDWYSDCTSPRFIEAVSTFALHPEAWTSSIIWYTCYPNRSLVDLDPRLLIKPNPLKETIPANVRQQLESLRRRFPALMTLHPTMVAIGADNPMFNLMELAETKKFSWRLPEAVHGSRCDRHDSVDLRTAFPPSPDSIKSFALVKRALASKVMGTTSSDPLAQALSRQGSSIDILRQLDADMRTEMFQRMRRIAFLEGEASSTGSRSSQFSFHTDAFVENRMPPKLLLQTCSGKKNVRLLICCKEYVRSWFQVSVSSDCAEFRHGANLFVKTQQLCLYTLGTSSIYVFAIGPLRHFMSPIFSISRRWRTRVMGSIS